MNRLRPPIAVAACVLAGAALAGCEASFHLGGKTVDSDQAEKVISSNLEDVYGAEPKALTCPDDVEAKEDETFTCTGESPENPPRPFEIEVTMTDDEGGIRFPNKVTFTDQTAESAGKSG